MYNPKVVMINSGYEGCSYVRIYLPCVYNGYWTDKPSMLKDRLGMDEIKQQINSADVVVFHRAEEQEYHKLAKMLKAQGKKIVMDNDDTFAIEGYHPLGQFTPDGKKIDNLKRRSDNINDFIKMCDLVTASTEVLADEYRKINPNTIVLPNYVDPDDWDKPKRNTGDKIKIGLIGSAAMEYDYLHIKDVIRQLSERDDVELIMFGLGDIKHRKHNPLVTKVFKEEYAFWDSIKMTQIPWCKRADYNKALNECKLDFMLIPRKENYFNTCKSNIKFLEASMCEIPVIVQSFKNSPYEEITDGVDGILIHDNKDWMDKIELLIKDKELRLRIGKNAHKYVLDNYNIENNAYKWANAYKSLFV